MEHHCKSATVVPIPAVPVWPVQRRWIRTSAVATYCQQRQSGSSSEKWNSVWLLDIWWGWRLFKCHLWRINENTRRRDHSYWATMLGIVEYEWAGRWLKGSWTVYLMLLGCTICTATCSSGRLTGGDDAQSVTDPYCDSAGSSRTRRGGDWGTVRRDGYLVSLQWPPDVSSPWCWFRIGLHP